MKLLIVAVQYLYYLLSLYSFVGVLSLGYRYSAFFDLDIGYRIYFYEFFQPTLLALIASFFIGIPLFLSRNRFPNKELTIFFSSLVIVAILLYILGFEQQYTID